MPIRKRDSVPFYRGSGVYSITNLINGKVYIGSALSIYGRIKAHRNCLRRGQHENSYLQRAWNKYGERAFRFDIVTRCEPSLTLEWEQFWIDNLETTNSQNGYNLCPFVEGGPMRGRKHSEESKAKMKEKQKTASKAGQPLATAAAAKVNKGRKMDPEVVKKRANTQRGRDLGEEWRKNLKSSHWSKRPDAAEIAERSAAKQRGRKLGPHSEEHRRKISEALLRRSGKI